MVLLAVNGTLMRGLKLNTNLFSVGAAFVRETQTAEAYRLYSINDEYPGMVKAAPLPPQHETKGGDAPSAGLQIAVEVWEVPAAGLVSVLQLEPPGLCVGKVKVEGAKGPSTEPEEVLGVLAEPWAVQGMKDITQFGGWRAYRGEEVVLDTAMHEEALVNRTLPESVKGVEVPPEEGPAKLPWVLEGIREAKGPGQVPAMPYNWPFDGSFSRSNTVLVIIDMQGDFCLKGGLVDTGGFGVANTQAVIQPTKSVLKACREAGIKVIHTREGHRPDLSDLPANKLWRTVQNGAAIGAEGPMGRILVRGEKGWDIIEELAPEPGEIVVDKAGKGSFVATDFHLLLQNMNAKNLVFAGVTTDVCVHTTIRDANDLGYECLLLADCTAAVFKDNYEAALRMVTMQGGIFGTATYSSFFLTALADGLLKD